MSEVYSALLYMVKRELSTKELEKMIKELEETIYTRNNIPF